MNDIQKRIKAARENASTVLFNNQANTKKRVQFFRESWRPVTDHLDSLAGEHLPTGVKL